MTPMSRRLVRGYSLLELLAYLAIFTVFMNLGLGLFLSYKRLHSSGVEIIERAEAVDQVGRVFRETVRAAHGMGEPFGTYESSEKQLVLRLDSAGDVIAVLGDVSGNGRFAKLIAQRDGSKWTPRYMRTYRAPLKGLAFSYEADAEAEPARWVQLQLEVDNALAPNTLAPVATFAASTRVEQASR